MLFTDVREALGSDFGEIYCLAELDENRRPINGTVGKTLGELAQKCYSEKILREPFSIKNIRRSKVNSSGYAELIVSNDEIMEFVKKYQEINYSQEL